MGVGHGTEGKVSGVKSVMEVLCLPLFHILCFEEWFCTLLCIIAFKTICDCSVLGFDFAPPPKISMN